MNLKKRVLTIMCAIALLCAMIFAGCEKNGGNTSSAGSADSANTSETSAGSSTDESDSGESKIVVSDDLIDKVVKELNIKANIFDDKDHAVGYQLEKPKSGDTVAVIETSMGTIKMRLFPEAAPKTVENFVKHAQDGYYNGLKFHRVINDFMIQTGDPKGDGTGGESIWGDAFEDEFSNKLFNIRGAVAMANSGRDTNGSQFFINQMSAETFDKQTGGQGLESFKVMRDSYMEGLQQYYDYGMVENFVAQYGNYLYDYDKVTDDIKKLYNENGGNPYLDGAYNLVDKGHTVFGQVYEGLDIVDAIAAVEVDTTTYAPKADVTIKTITIETYSE